MKQQQKIFVEFVGLAASGKSTIARALKERIEKEALQTCAARASLAGDRPMSLADTARHLSVALLFLVRHPLLFWGALYRTATLCVSLLGMRVYLPLCKIVLGDKILQQKRGSVGLSDQGALKFLAGLEGISYDAPSKSLHHFFAYLYPQSHSVHVVSVEAPVAVIAARRRARGDTISPPTDAFAHAFSKRLAALLGYISSQPHITVHSIESTQDVAESTALLFRVLALPKPTLVFVSTGLETGGAEMLILRHCRYLLAQNNFTIHVVSLTGLGSIGEHIVQEGISVTVLNMSKHSVVPLFRFWKLLRATRPAIMHSHLFHANFVARIVGALARVPVIISTIHNENFGGPLRERLLAYTDRLATRTVAISQTVYDAMIQKRVVPHGRLEMIPNGISLDEFHVPKQEEALQLRQALGIPEGITLFVAVGRLRKQKGYPYLLDAVDILRKTHSAFTVLVLGDGELQEALAGDIEKRKMGEYITLCGDTPDVKKYLYAADVFVMPSLWEGLPLALLEASACGLPAIASSVGAVPSVLKDGISGMLVPPQDSKALAQKMQEMCQRSSKARREMGKAAREIVEEHFGEKPMLLRYDSLYARLTK